MVENAPEIKLYSFANFDRSSRVRWLFYELGLGFEEIRLNYQNQEQYSSHYRLINPTSRIPSVSIDETIIFESGAIFSYFLQKYTN